MMIFFQDVTISCAKDPLQISSSITDQIQPEISIIPVARKRASFKIRLFPNEYSSKGYLEDDFVR